MASNNEYAIERYERFELEDEINELENINRKLEERIEELEKNNRDLDKENKHFKSTKAYKVWREYAKIKDKDNSKSKEKEDKSDENKDNVKNLKDIKVAIICDQFTYDSFKFEFTPISILPNNWKKTFEQEKPDLFFCETTWDGHNFEGAEGPWRHKVIKYYDEKENRKTLLKILKYCKENNIPTVFWSKEDPPDYRTELWSCAETAKEFEYIFTSSVECIPQYKKDFNHPNVGYLMFAAQPKLFNPLNLSGETIEELVFAGAYYPRYQERCKLMKNIFDKVLDEWGNLRLYDRNYYNEPRRFPKKYRDYTRPPIEYKEIPELYKKMEWGLNINTVTQSETMFARRIFELALSNVNILTNYSKGVLKIFEDNVFYIEDLDELPKKDGNWEEKRLNNLYNVLENHTYTERWKEILDGIDFPYIEDEDEIAILFKLNDLEDLKEISEKFEAIDYPYKNLNLLISSNLEKEMDIEEIKANYPSIDNVYNESNENYKKDMKKDLEERNIEYWIITDKDIEVDFIKKGILHYKYLNKRVSIAKGDEKFILGFENDIENKIVSKSNLNYLEEDNPKIDTYYI